MLRALAVLHLIAAPLAAADFPHRKLKTEDLEVTVYLPDAEKGMYRGTRFDWSGVLDVKFRGHKLFGPWLGNPDPKNPDSIVGPCEEFGMFVNPLGYDAAKVGGHFLKIGVGVLEKPKEEKYRFLHTYPIVKTEPWTIQTTDRLVTFRQSIATDFGYGYEYRKSVELTGRTLVIGHSLKNTGAKRILTDHYNHNFFNVDSDPVGPNYALEFPFEPKAVKPVERFSELVKLDGKRFALAGALDTGTIYGGLAGFDGTAKTTGVTMKHSPSGVSVRVTGDKPLKQFQVWGMSTTLCPEPFIELAVEPGKTIEWSWTYAFSK
jgi:hypothetical protein